MNKRYSIYKSNIDKLIELYPFIFNKNAPKPLAIGFFQQLCMDVRENDYNLSSSILRAALTIWTNRHEYLREVIKPNSVRYNLDGSVQGEISDDHKKAAITRKHKNRSASKRARQKRIAMEEERVSEIDKVVLLKLVKSNTAFVIESKGDLGIYYSGVSCGCEVWKSHVSRAAIFDTPKSALDEIELHNLEGRITEIVKWW